MKFHRGSDVLWFFVWLKGTPGPFPLNIAGYTRSEVMKAAEKQIGGGPWRRIYRSGGRVVRCRVVPL